MGNPVFTVGWLEFWGDKEVEVRALQGCGVAMFDDLASCSSHATWFMEASSYLVWKSV